MVTARNCDAAVKKKDDMGKFRYSIFQQIHKHELKTQKSNRTLTPVADGNKHSLSVTPKFFLVSNRKLNRLIFKLCTQEDAKSQYERLVN